MKTRTALGLLTVLSPLILAVSMYGGSTWVVVAALVAACGLPLLFAAVGTQGRGPSAASLSVIWLLLGGSWLGVGWLTSAADLAHPSTGEAAAVLLLLIVGLAVLPLLFVGWVFARTFRSEGLGPEELERLGTGEGIS